MATHVKDDINCKGIKLQSIFDDDVWVVISLRNGDNLPCGCIYRNPTKGRAATIVSTEKVCEVIVEAVQKNRSHQLICGDFNYPSIDWEHEYVAERSNIIPFLHTIPACFPHQHVFQPTRFRDGNEPSLLDLMTNEEGLLNDLAHNAALGNSDHECINFTLDCYKEVQCTTKKPNYFKADYISIRDRLSRVNWVTELRGDLATTSYINFFQNS